MKFKADVAIWSSGMERYVRSTHAEHAFRLCKGELATRISKSVIELKISVAKMRQEYEPPEIRAMAGHMPIRRIYHQHTTPNMDRKTSPACLYRADTGQTGGLQRVSFREVG